MRWGLWCFPLLLAACGGGDPVDLSEAVFEPTHVVEVDVELAPGDWDALRGQTRSIGELFGACLMEPFADPFDYFPATVTIDGERIEQVGLRKKGFLGSLDPDKPSLRIKFDEYVEGQRHFGLKAFTLNNSKQDPSYVHQCLAYQTFAAAGVPASRCNFAHVRVNGEDLGVFVHVEGGNKDFLRRHYDDPDGNLYEGTLSDFREGWTATFELKTNETANDRRDLAPLVAALALPDAELLAALEPLVDVEQFLTFWATEVLVTHWDGYAGNANNFFAYHDPASGKFQFIPWGADATFLATPSPFGGDGRTSVQASALLARRLYLLPATRDRYVAKLRALLADVWNETALLAEIDRMAALISPIAGEDPSPHLDEVRAFVRGRRAQIEAELAAGPPTWNVPLRDAPCFIDIGSLTGSFRTTWGTVGARDPFTTGTGTLGGTVLPAATRVGATVGADPADAARTQLAVVGALGDGSVAIVVFQLNPAVVMPGAHLPIDWLNVFGVVYRLTPATNTVTLVGLLSEGTLDLTETSTTPGAPVAGSFTATVIKNPF